MNKELIEALNILEKEKDISKESLFEAIENNLVVAYKNNFNKADNVTVTMDRETGDFHIYSQKEVVEEVMDPVTEISLEDARSIKGTYELGDIVNIEIQSKDFGRIATQRFRCPREYPPVCRAGACGLFPSRGCSRAKCGRRRRCLRGWPVR